ncbi:MULTISPECIES: hypothetical protein [Burkholderia]|uniref:Membrane protein n=1 Tax=Burkholderia paludis TaxID=1506587 RepID=A0A6P2SFM0_9BURK|nr:MULTISPECIES: hypothetical protein [Burkholderia]CAB3748338.1 hypothetical protein LMG30113_00638 [Burkholderia paludis]VWC46867.1 membrane protein [Burkholderia paludis]
MKKQVLLGGVMGVAVLLAACGGDDGGVANAGSSASNSNEAGTPTTTSPGGGQPLAQAACRPNGRFTYSGSASQVAANNGQLAVLVVPSLPTDYQKNRNITAPNAPASSQVQQASGAFTTLASSAAATDCLGLDHGAVTEIQSVGSDVAIGRWNQAMDTDGNTYTSEQGVHYAVGTPLSLSATSGTLACTQLIADTVAQNNSSVAGTLGASSATLDLGARTLTNLSLSINLGNSQYTLTNTQTPLNGVSTTGQLSVQTVVVGHDATQPLIAVGYSATLPNTNGVGGVVVLSCR